MVILGKMLVWLGLFVAMCFAVMAGYRLYQGITGNYGRGEALGDPLGAAIVYMMGAAVAWLISMLAKHISEDEAK